MRRSSSPPSKNNHPPVPVLPARDSVVFPGMIHTLHVAREGSKRAVRAAMAQNGPVFVVSQRDRDVEDPSPAVLFRIGCVCEPLQAVPLPDGSLRVALRPLHRAEAERFQNRAGFLTVYFAGLAEPASATDGGEALMRASVEAFADVLERGRKIPIESIDTVVHQETPGALADAIAHHLPLRPHQKQEILEILEPEPRLEAVFGLLSRERRVLGIQSEIAHKVDSEFAAVQREVFLREQLRAIQAELETFGEGATEFAALRERIEEAQMAPEAASRALQELGRLERQPPQSPESLVIRNYLDVLIALPWSRLSPDRLDVRDAQRVLDEAHYGLEPVKDRILDYLAVRQLNRSLRGPILCFVGPPGVGKTSVGRSIADALGREFVRISLGGVRDEAEIRGHRRTYVGAMPGRILQSLRQCGTRNPVMVLDEIDKMAADSRGDPSSALLEALDPAQNERFSDHFLETPFDLSAVLFIATANLVEDIPFALRDRLEIVRFASYTDEERLQIARRFILPRQIEAHGLADVDFRMEPSAMVSAVRDYTREAGVRELERVIGAICRKSARRVAETGVRRMRITGRSLGRLLGPPRYDRELAVGGVDPGVALALVVTEYGGSSVPIEVALMEDARREPRLQLTGNLGEVMKESAETALTAVESLGLGPRERLAGRIHIHVPDNAVPKEGPSAGLSIAVALASAWTGHPVRPGLAMTGEITLRGRLLAVGGVREKLVAARRAGVRTVLLPEANRNDLREVPRAVLAQLEIVFFELADAAIRYALYETPRATEAVVRVSARVKTGR